MIIKERIVSRRLPCRLTRSEALDRAQRLTELLDALSAKMKAKAEVMKEFATDIKDLQGEVNGMKLIVQRGEEMRTVNCRELFNFTAGLVHLVRLDTGDEVGEPRHVTEDERQGNFFSDIEEIDPTPVERDAAPSADEVAAAFIEDMNAEEARSVEADADAEADEFSETAFPEELPSEGADDPLLAQLKDDDLPN